MFHFGRLNTLREESNRDITDLGTKMQADNADLDVLLKQAASRLRDTAKQEGDLLDEIDRLKPPSKYTEFQRVFVQGKRKSREILLKMTDSIDSNQSEKLPDLVAEMEEVEARSRAELERVVRASGASSLNDFLGIDE